MEQVSLNSVVDSITLFTGKSAKTQKPYGFVVLNLKFGGKTAEYRTEFLNANDLYVFNDLVERSLSSKIAVNVTGEK